MVTMTRKHLWLACVVLLVSAVWFSSPHAQQSPGATFVQQSASRLDAVVSYATNTTSNTTTTITPTNANDSIYVYSVDIDNCGNATGGTLGAPTSLSTTGFLSGPTWTLGSGSTVAGTLGGPGLCQPHINVQYPTGLKSATPGANVTFVVPTLAANEVIRLNVGYRSAP